MPATRSSSSTVSTSPADTPGIVPASAPRVSAVARRSWPKVPAMASGTAATRAPRNSTVAPRRTEGVGQQLAVQLGRPERHAGEAGEQRRRPGRARPAPVIHVVPSRSRSSMAVAPPAATPTSTARAPSWARISGVPTLTLPLTRVRFQSPSSPRTGTMARKLTAIQGPSSSHGTVAPPSIVTPVCAHAPKPRAAASPSRNIAAPCLLVAALGEHGHDVGDDAEGGHGDEVERRLPEQPGDAVVDATAAAEELLAVAQVEVGDQQHGGQHRQGEQPPRAADEDRPREQRRPAQGQARRPQGQHGGDDRGGGDEQRDRHGDEAEDVEADGVGLGAPGAAVDGVRGEHDAARHEPHPVGGGAGPGEGHGRGARPAAARSPWRGRSAAAAPRGTGPPSSGG